MLSAIRALKAQSLEEELRALMQERESNKHLAGRDGGKFEAAQKSYQASSTGAHGYSIPSSGSQELAWLKGVYKGQTRYRFCPKYPTLYFALVNS